MSWRKIREARAREERVNWWVVGGIVGGCASVAFLYEVGQTDLVGLAALTAGCLVAYGLQPFGDKTVYVIAGLLIVAGTLHVLTPWGDRIAAALVWIGVYALDRRSKVMAGEEPTVPSSIAASKRKSRKQFKEWARSRRKPK